MFLQKSINLKKRKTTILSVWTGYFYWIDKSK